MLSVLRLQALLGASRGFLGTQGLHGGPRPLELFSGGSCGQLGDTRGFLVPWKLKQFVGIAWGSWGFEVPGVR